MSDAEHEITSSAVPSEAGQAAPADIDMTKTKQSASQLQEPGNAATTSGDDTTNAQLPDQPEDTIDIDSEAETLIQSPEKKRNIIESAPRLRPTGGAGAKDNSTEQESIADEVDGRKRKRKRIEDDTNEHNASRTSSRRSSSLSSASSDHDSEASIRHKTENTRLRRRNGLDKDMTTQTGERTVNTQLKVRKRRPSDILPRSAKHRTKHQNNSIDNSSLLERRETRSATYPRRSSDERSLSPEPTSNTRRGHTRVASSSLATERKRRGPLPHINTQRSRSIDRQSTSGDESSSPRPTRPRLHKFASGEHDTISPAKAMAIRKNRDRNGRTHLARACNNNEFANVKSLLAERPADLNVADNAGNTPLQIAALEGFTDCVRHLLQNHCEVDTLNCDKDTPLIDAVENAHVEVVRLLLDHGADPRRQNAKGEEPSELVPTENPQDYQEIRRLLQEAKLRTPKRKRTDDQADSGNREGSSRAASAASPRDSPPPLGPRSPPTVVSRRKTGRSESTPNHLLWQANTPENLIKLAEKGDVPGVASILNVINTAGPESLIAAAKAGHEEVLQLLLGMGSPDPNPSPVASGRPGYNTPMLAAIGRGKPEIVKLLLEQNSFNPAVEYKGRKYFELSAERQGHEWRKEHKMLLDAYEKYVAGKPKKHTSPRKARELEKEKSRQARDSSSPIAVKQRPQTRSPALSHKSLPEQTSSGLRDGKRNQNGSAETSEKGKNGHTRKPILDRSIAVASDQEPNVRKTHKSRRSQSDIQAPSDQETDISRKRRRLVTGKEHRRVASSTMRNAESDDESTRDPSIKAERSENPGLKRSRSSFSPEQTRTEANTDSNKTMTKKRRTVLDSSSPEETRLAPKKKMAQRRSSRESTQTIEVKMNDAKVLSDVDEVFKTHKRRKSSQTSITPSTIEIGSTLDDTRAPENHPAPEQAQAPTPERALLGNEPDPIPSPKVLSPAEAESDPSKEDEALQAAARQAEEEEARKVAEEQARREMEEAAEAERKKLEEIEARRMLEEAEAKKRADEEILAKKKQEEERLEQLRKEMEERRRRQEEQKLQEFLETERLRREALPSALCECARKLDLNDASVRSHDWLKRFKDLYTVTTAQIDPDCSQEIKDEEWIPNFQVASLLATKDLRLRQYTSFEMRRVRGEERQALWRVANMDLSYDYNTNAFNTTVSAANKAYEENMRKFMAMEDLFWVKWSDFNDQVFRHPHLAGLTLKRQRILLKWPVLQTVRQNSVVSPTQKEPALTNGVSPYTSTAMGH